MNHELIREPSLYIDGEWAAGGGGERDVENPATQAQSGVFTQASPSDVERAVRAARGAFESWSQTTVPERVRLLHRLADEIVSRTDEFSRRIECEQGSPQQVARKLHVDTPVGVIGRTADALEDFPFRRRRDNSVILREPVGVVAAITPWNLPLHQIIVKVVPALAAGCTVVLKPATLTPLTAFELARAFEAAGFPRGVVNLVTGTGSDVGDQLCRHPDVDHVSFTGSTAVGKNVAAAAVGTIKGVTLELSGKSASVVLSDVSDRLLAKAVKVTVDNCFRNGGQMSTALSRLIVPTAKLRIVEELAVAAAALHVPGETLGPLISAGRRFAVESYLEPGTAKAVTPDMPLPERGYYVSPTVFTDVHPDSPLAQEEIFGPVLSIIPAESDEAAIDIANNSLFGLNGALWIQDQHRALDWAARIRAGQVDVNAAAFNPRAPFGGYKQSGIGRETGAYGIDELLEVKSVQLRPNSPY